MNRVKKAAWLGLTISTLLLAVLAVMSTYVGRQLRVLQLFGVLAVLGLTGLSFIILRRKQSQTEVDSDERDKLIIRKAFVATYFSLWCLLVVVCLIPQFVIGQEHQMPVGLLPLMLLGIMFICNVVYCFAVLVQYGWGGKGGEETD
ncbi:MAG TPA: hypothetical protein VMX13_01810 [Sedimentisphaerales bacterium]|nr:hypothetical protein [Sedimentisphaerales bacterium]